MHRSLTLPIVVTALLLASTVAPARAESEPNAASWYDLDVRAPSKVAKGGVGSVTVHITPKGAAEIHKEAPIKVTLKPPSYVDMSKTELGRKELKMDGNSASFDVPFTAREAGTGNIEATVSFYICTEQVCAHQERKASLPVAVR